MIGGFMQQFLNTGIIFGLLIFPSIGAQANPISFTGRNAAIFSEANPLNQQLMLESTVRPANPALTSSLSGITPASLILQSVEGQISNKINSEIFNGSNASGFFDLGGGNSINYLRTGGNIVINITDPVHGTTTITVPDI
jgi:hypothetical protein